MSKSLTGHAVSEVAKSMQEALRRCGFKRMGPHLVRSSEDVFHGVHFQVSRWGTSREGKFTVNLVVTASGLYESWTGKPLPANPATAAFPVQQRIGSLMQDHKDKWWEVAEGTDLRALEAEVANVVVTHALPFFDQFTNTRSLLAKLRQTGGLPGLTASQAKLVHAMLAQELGNHLEAATQIHEAVELAGKSPFKTTVLAVAGRIDVPVPT